MLGSWMHYLTVVVLATSVESFCIAADTKYTIVHCHHVNFPCPVILLLLALVAVVLRHFNKKQVYWAVGIMWVQGGRRYWVAAACARAMRSCVLHVWRAASWATRPYRVSSAPASYQRSFIRTSTSWSTPWSLTTTSELAVKCRRRATARAHIFWCFRPRQLRRFAHFRDSSIILQSVETVNKVFSQKHWSTPCLKKLYWEIGW